MLKEQIAASLEEAFSQYGFAEPSVARLKSACNVSLRTLYKYYPSKEAMIIAALEYRHQRYLEFLMQDAPADSLPCLIHIFNRLELWMQAFAPHGCMSINAISAFPDNQDIAEAVKRHKQEVCQLLGRQSGQEDLSTELFLLHEGVSSAWPVIGKPAVTSAQKAVEKCMGEI